MVLRWKDKSLSSLDKTKLLRNSGTYGLLLVALVAMTFFGVCDPQTGLQGPSGSAAKVNGDVISSLEFRRAYQQAYQQALDQRRENFDPAAMQLSRNVMRQLVNERALWQTAVSMGLEATEQEVIKIIAEADIFKNEDGTFSSEAFKNYLRANRHTEKSFHDELRRRLTVGKFEELIASTGYVSYKAAELEYRAGEVKLNLEYLQIDPAAVTVTVTADDVKNFLNEEGKKRVQEFYEANRGDYNTEEKVRARHILVSFSGARNASAEAALRSKEDGRKRAEEILGRVKAPRAEFAKIAGEWTDEPAGKTKGGDLGLFTREAMVKEFSDAAFALQPGEISGVVESPFGFHIIKAEERQAARNQSVEDVTDQIARRILERERKPALVTERATKALEAAKAGNASQLKSLGLEWKETGEVSGGSRFFPVLGSDPVVISAIQGLKTAGQVHEGVLDVRESKFIVRLKSRTDADLSKLTADRKKELAESAAFSQGYTTLSALRTAVRTELEKNKKLWENPDFAMQDEIRAAANQASEATPGS